MPPSGIPVLFTEIGARVGPGKQGFGVVWVVLVVDGRLWVGCQNDIQSRRFVTSTRSLGGG